MCGCHEASGGLKGGQHRGPQWGRADLKRGAGLWIPPHPAASCGVERAFLFQRAFLSKNVANFRMPLSKGDTSTHPPFLHRGGKQITAPPFFLYQVERRLVLLAPEGRGAGGRGEITFPIYFFLLCVSKRGEAGTFFFFPAGYPIKPLSSRERHAPSISVISASQS